MQVPAALLRHTILVEPYAGVTATGPTWYPGRTIPCYVEALTRSARKPDSRTIVGGDRIICQLDTTIRPEDRITHDGRTVEIVTVRHFRARIGTPDHTQIDVI